MTVELGGLDLIQYKHCWIRWIRLNSIQGLMN